LPDPAPIPPELGPLLHGRRISLAYGGTPVTATWRASGEVDTWYVKVAPVSWEPSLASERDRTRWAASRLPVPRVIAHGENTDVAWLVTQALPGLPGTDDDLLAHPDRLVPLLARGLRAFHDTPAVDCPFDFGVDAAIRHVRRRAHEGRIDPEVHFHPEHRHLTVDSALNLLVSSRPDEEDLVVCHGDYCPPNVLIDGEVVSGYVDLGEVGVADRWWDLAVATWSLEWNVGPGWERRFLDAYGIQADPRRTAFFRLLYDLAS